MALIDIKFSSQVLRTNVDIRVVLPTPKRPEERSEFPFYQEGYRFQVLYLLHGMRGDASVWTRYTNVERWAEEHKLCLVCPSVANSFYLDMVFGERYLTFMSEELPAFIEHTFPVSKRRENTFVAGLSMGAYGSFRLALEQPERFWAAASLSGALDLVDLSRRVEEDDDAEAFVPILGLEHERLAENDLFRLIEKRKAQGFDLPRFYQICGVDDFLYGQNTSARDRFLELGVDLTYAEAPGEHTWDFWNAHIQEVLAWLPLSNTLVREG